MKTLYIFLLLIALVSGSYAQTSVSTVEKNGTSFSGINAENQLFSIAKIYPNPVKDFVTVELRSVDSGSLQASLINILGVEVKKWESNVVTIGDQKLKFDLSFMKTGVYFLKISNSDKVITQVLKKN